MKLYKDHYVHINMTTLQVHILKHREGTSEHECKIFATELLFLNLKKKKRKKTSSHVLKIYKNFRQSKH